MSQSSDDLFNWDQQNPGAKEQTYFPVVVCIGPTPGCLYIYIYIYTHSRVYLSPNGLEIPFQVHGDTHFPRLIWYRNMASNRVIWGEPTLSAPRRKIFYRYFICFNSIVDCSVTKSQGLFQWKVWSAEWVCWKFIHPLQTGGVNSD